MSGVFWLASAGIAIAFLVGPIGAAFARWIDSRSARGRPQADDEVLDAQREQMEVLAGRVNELEERLDFAERMLAQQRDVDRIGKGAPDAGR